MRGSPAAASRIRVPAPRWTLPEVASSWPLAKLLIEPLMRTMSPPEELTVPRLSMAENALPWNSASRPASRASSSAVSSVEARNPPSVSMSAPPWMAISPPGLMSSTRPSEVMVPAMLELPPERSRLSTAPAPMPGKAKRRFWPASIRNPRSHRRMAGALKVMVVVLLPSNRQPCTLPMCAAGTWKSSHSDGVCALELGLGLIAARHRLSQAAWFCFGSMVLGRITQFG